MSFELVLAFAVCATAAFLITASRAVGFRTLVKNSVIVDIVYTGGSLFMMMGTLTGMMTAVVSGLFMAVFLSICKFFYKPTDEEIEQARLNKIEEEGLYSLPV